MTPRHADIVFVLEGLEGLGEVRAVLPGSRMAAELDITVHLHGSPRQLAVAHYELLRVLTHAECGRVMFHHLPLSSAMAEQTFAHVHDQRAKDRAGRGLVDSVRYHG